MTFTGVGRVAQVEKLLCAKELGERIGHLGHVRRRFRTSGNSMKVQLDFSIDRFRLPA